MLEVARSIDLSTCAVVDRFNLYLFPEPNSGCWFWMGGLLPTGYGRFNYAPASNYAHRASFLLANGELPDGDDICHRCDIRCCVNPYHLFAGSRSDNIRDMIHKGRAGFQKNPQAYVELGRQNGALTRGEDNSGAVLSDQDVAIVKYLLRRGSFAVDIAKVFDVHVATIRDIKAARSWRHVN